MVISNIKRITARNCILFAQYTTEGIVHLAGYYNRDAVIYACSGTRHICTQEPAGVEGVIKSMIGLVIRTLIAAIICHAAPESRTAPCREIENHEH